jgi:hypothetical protein
MLPFVCLSHRLVGLGYWLWFLVVLVVVAVAQRRLGPGSSATTSTTERALPSSAVQLMASASATRPGGLRIDAARSPLSTDH